MSRTVKNRVGTEYTARHIFYAYRKKAKKAKLPFIPYGDFRRFMLDFHAEIVRECTENKFEFKAPSRLGTFKIAKKKICFTINEKTNTIDQKYVMIDWAKTKEMWTKNPKSKENKKFIFFTNRHTNGYYFKWEWSRRIAAFHNADYYIFLPLITVRGTLYETIMKDPANYDAYMAVPSKKSMYYNGQ